MFYFDKKLLLENAVNHSEQYGVAHPFPHVVFDNLVPAKVLEEVVEEFPVSVEDWKTFSDAAQTGKFSCENESMIPPATRHLLQQFNSSVFIDFLEKLTGIEGLIPDPHFRGGGLHQTFSGGKLDIHADFNVYKRLQVFRRINVILYLNKDWKEEYGGALELWDKNMTSCVKRVLPEFNRMVIFNTDNFSYHGHPDPLSCPEGESRKSLALYYYTATPPAGVSQKPHTIIFRKRPGKDFDFASNYRLSRVWRVLQNITNKIKG